MLPATMWRPRATLTAVLLVVASLPGPLFLIWVTSYHQLSLSPDSASYISAANSLGEGALKSYDGSPYVRWPPMLPWVLASLSFIGISVSRAAAIINASSWFAAALISGVWLRNLIGNSILACAIALWVSISAPVLSVALFVWSEVLFSFFLIFSLWALHRYLSGRGRRALLMAGLSCGSAMLTRYVGAVLFGVELLVLSLFASVQRRLWFLAGFAAIAGAPLSAWIIRNVFVAGSATGMRYASDQGLKETFYSTAHEVGSWFIPQPFADFNAVAGTGVLIVQAAGVALSLRRLLRKERSSLPISTLLLGAFSIAYLGAIILASVQTNACCVGGRFEAPVFPALVLGATLSTFLLTEAATRSLSNGKLIVKTVTALFVLLGISVSLSSSISHANIFWSDGPEQYSRALYSDQDWIAYAKKLSPDVSIFSNAPAAVYLGAGLRAAYTPPSRAYASSVTFDERPAFARLVTATPRVLIVWFKEKSSSFLFDLKALQTVVRLRLVADFAHVSVYECTTKPIN